MRTPWLSVVLLLSFVCITPEQTIAEMRQAIPGPVSGRTVSIVEIIPADVLARVELVKKTIEVIRFEMGKPKASLYKPIATNAQPHEIYFQAMTLFLKADRLALELTGSTGIPPEIVKPSGIRSFHIWKMVNAAYSRILTVVHELEIPDKPSEQTTGLSTTQTDVGRAILQTNRQINLLLERRFVPSDVYQQVTMAIRYTQSLLTQFPGAQDEPHPHRYERGKKSSDVYIRLIRCFSYLEDIARQSNLKVLHLNRELAEKAVKKLGLHSSGVYDVATLLVSDLAYLHAQMPQAKFPGSVPYPGRKFPAHVFQQSGLLLDLLIQLEQQVKVHPHWLDS